LANVRRINLDRRWWVAIGVAVVALAAVVLSRTVFGGPSQECKPVIDFLDFNKAQAAVVSAHAQDHEGETVPSQTEDIAYQTWADGLSERAGKVTDPGLAARAVRVAQLASQFTSDLPRLREATAAQAPGAPAPPIAYEMSALNDQITNELAELSKSCKK